MSEPKPNEAETRGGSCAPAPCSAWVYSGPHYGRKHKVLGQRGTLVEVEYHGDRFAVPYCDLEYESPKCGLGAAGAQVQGRGRDMASQQTLSPNDQAQRLPPTKPFDAPKP